MLMIQYVRTMLRNEKGQGMVEYGLILAVVAIAVIAGMGLMENGIEGLFARVTTALGIVR